MHSSLAAFVLGGRWQAVLVTAVGALLAQLFLPLGYLSGAAVALVTLRLGWQHGLSVIVLSLIPVSVLHQLTASVMGSSALGLQFTVVLWLPVWAVAQSLRRTRMPGRSVMLASLFGIMIVLGFGFTTEDPAAWWQQTLNQALMPMTEGLPQDKLDQILADMNEVSLIMTGTSALLISLSVVFSLFIGRWWQALRYNPGGFGDEFRRLRLGKSAVALLLLVLLAVSLSGNEFLLHNLPVLLLLPLLMQGLAIIHAFVKWGNGHVGWLVGTYLLLFVAGPMALLLAIVGVADNWVNFRARFRPDNESDDT